MSHLKPCAVPSCLRIARCRGFCDAHYRRLKKGGSLRPEMPIGGFVKKRERVLKRFKIVSANTHGGARSRAGRSRKPGWKLVGVRLEVETGKLLKTVARAREISASELANEILKRYLRLPYRLALKRKFF